jgi:hypothetical protein
MTSHRRDCHHSSPPHWGFTVSNNSLTAGQELYLVYYDKRRGAPRTVTVESIGRAWVTLSFGKPAYRFRADDPNMRIDGRGYTSPGRCYLDGEEYERNLSLDRAWRDLRLYLDRKMDRPEGVSIEDMRQALRLLGAGE